MSISEFLLARVTEDERRADYFDPLGAAVGPARILAECRAKRRLVEGLMKLSDPFDLEALVATEATLRVVAQVYADHPEFDPSWRL